MLVSKPQLSRREIGWMDNSIAHKVYRAACVHSIQKSSFADFESSILQTLGVPAHAPDREMLISSFFNEQSANLIFEDSIDGTIRKKEHLFKRMIALGEWRFINYAANHPKYELDWNFYEMVDGEKETLLDYLDMIINDEEIASEYNVDELKDLIGVLEEAGGKRGRELE